ncbi:type II and III secretion system protein family protein [Pandoraea sp. SD6-2]|uniref:type II and III secretion system protein family protein n=1 Tax=Pandoraea sp. SD6-2 TaxID=1286093 RepID=UPI00032D7B68|nr:type II and III secretion system protein family protein [Pandoraea sp. SD6-2]EON13734.1 type II and III secretion system protein [Pandoraea sp. SD6-2]
MNRTRQSSRTHAFTRAALAVAACGMLAATAPAGAQTAVEYGAVANGAPGKTGAAAAKGSAPMQMTISMTPSAPPANAAAASTPGSMRGPNCTGELRNERTVVVPIGKSTVLQLEEPVRNRTLGDPSVAQAAMVSPRAMYLLGLSVGTTNMIVQGRSGACEIVNVVVNGDAGGVQTSLAQLMPEEHGIRVTSAGANLVLAGRVSSAIAAQQAVEIAKAYAKRGNADGTVLNMMSVDTPQQVMLEVKVAEVSKTLINQLGSALNLQGGFGTWTGALVSNLLSGAATALTASKANRLPLQLSLDAQKTDNLVKILAEPNLVTLSGQEASFLSGGKIFIPVPQSNGSTTVITLQQEEFGVALKFLPTVLDGGRINLRVAPEVSELSPTGVTLTATNINGVNILPLITTRRASTTVQMRDGETFAIGGLVKNNISGALKAFPGLGEVPVLGTLMRSTSFQNDLTELVFIITPHLVKPLQTAAAELPMPTDSFTTPSAIDIYATGNMEGRGQKSAPSAPNAPAPQPAAAPGPQPARPSSSAPSSTPNPANAPTSSTGAAPSTPAATAAAPGAAPASVPAPAALRAVRTEAHTQAPSLPAFADAGSPYLH